MGFYADHILPRLIARAMRNRDLLSYRQRVIPRAEGRVLEIGIGAGANLPFYSPRVQEVIGLEPAARLVDIARRAARGVRTRVSFLQASAEAIPLDTHSVDSVVMTWTLCSIPDAGRALAEIRRVLVVGGSLLFVEHGLAPDERVRRWQRRLTPVWRRLAGGCHLDRAVDSLVANAGFQVRYQETGYMRGPRPLTFIYEGSARSP